MADRQEQDCGWQCTREMPWEKNKSMGTWH